MLDCNQRHELFATSNFVCITVMRCSSYHAHVGHEFVGLLFDDRRTCCASAVICLAWNWVMQDIDIADLTSTVYLYFDVMLPPASLRLAL